MTYDLGSVSENLPAYCVMPQPEGVPEGDVWGGSDNALYACFRSEPDGQRFLPDTDEQAAVYQKAEPAEHSLLYDVHRPEKSFPDAFGQFFIGCH